MNFLIFVITLLSSILTSESKAVDKEFNQDVIYNDPESNILSQELQYKKIHEFIDLMFRPVDPNEMKKGLDKFAMVRKKTFVVTPEYNKDENKDEILDGNEENSDSDNYLNDKNSNVNWEVRYRKNININHFNKYSFDNDPKKINIRTDFKHADDDLNFKIDNVKQNDNNSNENDPIKQSQQMWKVLSRQNELIEKLASKYHEMILKEVEKPKHDSFNEILRSAKMKRKLRQNNETTTTEETTAARIEVKDSSNKRDNAAEVNNTTTSKENTDLPSTIKTVFDETEIKNALKKDPFVQRILKMANKKKEEYFKKMEERNNNQKFEDNLAV